MAMKINTFTCQYTKSFVNNCSQIQGVIFSNNILITMFRIICCSTSINKSLFFFIFVKFLSFFMGHYQIGIMALMFKQY